MNIAGMIPSSLVDFPEKISCVVFTQGCNFRCPFCHNPDLVPVKPPAKDTKDMEHVLEFLDKRRGLLDGVVVSGGEPTLQKGLVSFLSRVKNKGFLVKLDTNGSNPQVLRSLLDEGLVDFVAMDLKTSPDSYHPFIMPEKDHNRLLASIDVVMSSAPDYEFRTTCVAPFVTEKTLARILSHIPGANRFALQRFRPQVLLDPGFFSDVNPTVDDENLARFRTLALGQVKTCVIR